MDCRIKQLTGQLEDIQDNQLWMGKNYSEKIALLHIEEYFVRPYPTLHCVAEIVAHLTAWRKDALLKITDGRGLLKDNMPENWPIIEDLKKIGWPKIWEDYRSSTKTLLLELEGKKDSFLDEVYFDQDFKNEYPYSFLLEGILHHDIYHLGQIGIIIKLILEQRRGA